MLVVYSLSMRNLFLFLMLLFCGLPACAYDIAFPLEKNITIEQDGIFFVGKTDKKETLWINDVKVTPKENGSFAESFKLNEGENIFYLGVDKEHLNEKYVVNRVKPNNSASELVEFSIKDYKTSCDNVILRTTPIDFGMNRVGYLPKNTDLKITGTKNEFSRVYLNKNLSGWVQTKHIIPELRDIVILGEFRGQSLKSEHDFETRVYKFSKNLPYSIIFDKNKLLVDVYNVENRANETFHTEICLKEPYCYSSKMQDGELVITVPHITLTKKSMKIIIDPGHGGKENGAVGCLSDLEKDMNLKASKTLAKMLKSQKYNVLLTRKKDKYVSLQDRVRFTKDKKGVIFISLHMNSVPENINPNSHKGTETYYYTDFSKPLAQNIQSELVNSLHTKNNGVIQASYAVIRPTEYVSVLVETAYLVNPEDVKIYKSKTFFKQVAEGITNGLNKYINEIK